MPIRMHRNVTHPNLEDLLEQVAKTDAVSMRWHPYINMRRTIGQKDHVLWAPIVQCNPRLSAVCLMPVELVDFSHGDGPARP